MNEPTYTSEITARLIQHIGNDAMIVAAARVSTSGDEALKYLNPLRQDGNHKLISYLIKQRHGSPFEHGSLTFFISAPLFVFREFQRHRIGWSYNEWSGRYSEMQDTFWIPARERKAQPVPGFKPARPEFMSIEDDREYEIMVDSLKISYELAYSTYQRLLKRGVGKEVARVVLPLGMYSSMWATCNPRSLMHFLSLRTHVAGDPIRAAKRLGIQINAPGLPEFTGEFALFTSYPQQEIEEVARQMEAAFAEHWPLTYKAWQDAGRVAP